METLMKELLPQTKSALFALHYRAIESSLTFGLFKDLQAERWVKELDFEFAPADSPSHYAVQLATACRTELFNQEIEGFEGRVLNLGCGFCTRSINHNKESWINVDRKEVMDMRSYSFAGEWDTGPSHFYEIEGDIQDLEFIISLKSKSDTLILLEGVLDYYSKEEVYNVLSLVRTLAPNLTIILDACGSVYKDIPHPIQSKDGPLNIIRFGLDNPKDLEHLGYKVLRETSIYELAKDRWEPLEESYKKHPIMKEHATRVIVLEGV